MRAFCKWVGRGILLLVLVGSASFAQPPASDKTPPAKQPPKSSKLKQPEWKNLLEQASECERKGNTQKAKDLLEKAYRTAPAGEDKAEVAFQLGVVCEKQKLYSDARRWYLQTIYDAPKGPLATKAREKMRALPDPRRPSAAGATPTGGVPPATKPK
jgi:tetratricopeptide (TPR) repeat protein